jgi:hypothetical protein
VGLLVQERRDMKVLTIASSFCLRRGYSSEKYRVRNCTERQAPAATTMKGASSTAAEYSTGPEEEPVKTESPERAQDRHAQRQKHPAERSETTPERARDDCHEEYERDADIPQAVPVDPADDHRRAVGANRDARPRALGGDPTAL